MLHICFSIDDSGSLFFSQIAERRRRAHVKAATLSRAAAAADGTDVADVLTLEDDGGVDLYSDAAADDAMAVQLGRDLTNTATIFPENYCEPVLSPPAPRKGRDQSPRLQLPLPDDCSSGAAPHPLLQATESVPHFKNARRGGGGAAFILPTLPPVPEEAGGRISLPEPAQEDPSAAEFMVGAK